MRREDLTEEIRLEIAYQAYHLQGNYGEITKLAEKYEICRSFVYVLLNIFKAYLGEVFSAKEKEKVISKKELIGRMAFLRMVGRNSINSISEIMKYDNLKYSGMGTISQSLCTVGSLLPSVQYIPSDSKIEIVAVADEIFIGNQPIFITLDPISSVILSISLEKYRDKESWESHLNEIEDGNINIISMVSDEGKGLVSAIKNKDILWQPDVYHTIAHRLGSWVHRLEQRAYKRIGIEYQRKAVISSAKSPKVINKRRYKYAKACEQTIKAIEIYENFCYLYQYIINEIQPFHSNGELRDRLEAKENIEVALELIETLENEPINNQIRGIRRILPELLNYFDEAKRAIIRCKALKIDDENITLLTLLWKWGKSVMKAKKSERKTKVKQEYNFYLQYAKDTLGDKFMEIKTAIFNELDKIIQASSMVENINSILRPYLNNSKNQITQEFLNLFAFYHNHRRYKDGKRKGKIPMEMITGKKQKKDWLELLTDFIEKTEPQFFL